MAYNQRRDIGCRKSDEYYAALPSQLTSGNDVVGIFLGGVRFIDSAEC